MSSVTGSSCTELSNEAHEAIGASMLVLNRKIMEEIIIGDDIRVTVADIRGDKVRLGIEAPKEVSVHRKEVWEAIQLERKVSHL